jgi:hypothetical protein
MTRRDRIKTMLRAVGLDRVVSRLRYCGRLVVNKEFRRLEMLNARVYQRWRRAYGDVLRPPLRMAGAARRALLVGKGTMTGATLETALIKGLELGGFVPAVLIDRRLAKYYRLAGVRDFAHWEQYLHAEPTEVAARIVAQATQLDDLIGLEHRGARVGRFALSTTFRALRVGRLDLSAPLTRQRLVEHFAMGMARAEAAHRLLDRLRPDVVVFMGNRYTGHAEMMDVAIDRGIDVLAWFDAHRSSALVLKRYNRGNRDQHHASLSDASWRAMREAPWGAAQRETLRRELAGGYAAGDWYSRGGTQFNKRIVPADVLRRDLGLDPAKKTAVIFPHVIWDATLFWGEDLFPNYEDWLIESVRAACANTALNWVIKIHPVHIAKNASAKTTEEAGELVALRRRIGPLPPHVKVIPPETAINTYSLFGVMDYCLTVRGTIGIESASLGIRVLTAGTGRYDHRGFTVDSASAAEYLARLAQLHTLPPMTGAERELAERYAYAAFLLRPLPLTSFTITHQKNAEATTHVSVTAKSSEELRSAADLRAFGAWAADGQDEDFLWARPGKAAMELTAQ